MGHLAAGAGMGCAELTQSESRKSVPWAAADLDGDVAALLGDKLEFDPDLQHQVTQVSREVANGTIEAVTATTRFYDEMTRLYKDLPTQYFIRRTGGQWSVPLQLGLQPETSVIDVMALDSAAQQLLLLTDREGFRASDDGGASWREFNHRRGCIQERRARQRGGGRDAGGHLCVGGSERRAAGQCVVPA